MQATKEAANLSCAGATTRSAPQSVIRFCCVVELVIRDSCGAHGARYRSAEADVGVGFRSHERMFLQAS